MELSRLVLTTGQAAGCCLVSADTVVNWIKAGKLAARRTVGGQYRIRIEDLREFMQRQGLAQPAAETQTAERPMCWQFHSDRHGDPVGTRPCEGCLVRHLGVRDCFKLMALRPESGRSDRDCEACAYYRRWAHEPTGRER